MLPTFAVSVLNTSSAANIVCMLVTMKRTLDVRTQETIVSKSRIKVDGCFKATMK